MAAPDAPQAERTYVTEVDAPAPVLVLQRLFAPMREPEPVPEPEAGL